MECFPLHIIYVKKKTDYAGHTNKYAISHSFKFEGNNPFVRLLIAGNALPLKHQ